MLPAGGANEDNYTQQIHTTYDFFAATMPSFQLSVVSSLPALDFIICEAVVSWIGSIAADAQKPGSGLMFDVWCWVIECACLGKVGQEGQ